MANATLNQLNYKGTLYDIEDSEARNELATKADANSVYTKTEVDTALSAKADKSTTYTKTEVDTALGNKIDKEIGKGLSTNDFTTVEKTKLAGIAEGAEVNVQSNWTQTTTTADDYIKNKPTLGTAAAKNATDTYNATGTDVTTGKAVAAALATLPEPMVFKGSLGTGGTITTLPTASSSNKGDVYKVITAGTYASQSAKVGDTFISDGSTWVLIPSGDEPSGTVTSVGVVNSGGLTINGSPITSSGTITVGHQNSVTAKTSSSLKKFTYDVYGHVTGSSELSTAEANALASGIDSAKVAQIETNKTNISTLETMNGQKNLLYVPSSVTVTDDYLGSPIVFTADSDGYVTASPQTDSRYFQYTSSQYKIDLSAGDYVLYADIKTTVDSANFKATLLNTSNTTIAELSMRNKTGVTTTSFTIATSGSYGLLAKLLGGSSRFMILKKSIWDAGFTAYQPYAMTNAELTAAIQALQAQLNQ